MIVKCSIDSAQEKTTCCYADGRRETVDDIHYNDLINIDLVCSFIKEDFSEPSIAFAFENYVFGERTHRWKYENKDERDSDFEKLLKLVVHQL